MGNRECTLISTDGEKRPAMLPGGTTNLVLVGGRQGPPWSGRSVHAVSLASLSVHQRCRYRVHFPAGRACCARAGECVSRGASAVGGTRKLPRTNPRSGEVESVPRHVEIPNKLARKICRGLSVPEVG
jgi:hypothetical protein